MKSKICLLSLLMLLSLELTAQRFKPLASGVWDDVPGSFAGDVYAMTMYNGKLIAGGEFLYADTVLANNVAAWDGQKWESLGLGVYSLGSTYVYALQEHNGLLYIGGDFDSAGSMLAANLVAWNGSNYVNVNYPNTWEVFDMVVYNNQLHVVDRFGIYNYNGLQWDTLLFWDNQSFFGETMRVFQGKLYFSWANYSQTGNGYDKIWSWDGTNLTLHSVITEGDDVFAMTVYNNELYLGGGMDTMSNVSVRALAKLAINDSLQPVLNGVSAGNDIYALTEFKGRLFIGGEDWSNINNSSIVAQSLCAWNGTSYEAHGIFPIDPSFQTDIEVYSLQGDGDKLYIGGEFDTSYGMPGNGIFYLDWNVPYFESSINGIIYYDIDSTCLYTDTIDFAMKNVLVKATPGPYYGISNADGEYHIFVPPGYYTVKPSFVENRKSFCADSIAYVALTDPFDQEQGVDFSFRSVDSCVSLQGYVNTDNFIFCRENVLRFYMYNAGGDVSFNTTWDFCLPQNFTLLSNYAFIALTNDSIALINNGNNCYSYNLSNLLAGEVFYTYVKYKVSCDPNDYAKNMKITVEYLCYNKCQGKNNGGGTGYEISGPIDPNDKLVLSSDTTKGYLHQDTITGNDDLYYQIRFQNVGTSPAVNVVVYDTLSPFVDLLTFSNLLTSHDCRIDIISNNIIRWSFENINLPDSTTDEPNSHGYILYSIGQSPGNTIGTWIHNAAAVYFDFNAPVITNTASCLIDQLASIHELYTNNEVSVFPIPNSGSFTIVLDELQNNISTSLYSITGQLVQENNITQSKAIDVHCNVAPDIYVLKVKTDRNIYYKKITIQ